MKLYTYVWTITVISRSVGDTTDIVTKEMYDSKEIHTLVQKRTAKLCRK